MRMNNYEIKKNEIIVNEIYYDNEIFVRYYHHNKTPTRYFASRTGRIFSEISNKIMKPGTNPKGYHYIGAHFKPHKKKKYLQLQKIIATVFCGGYHKGLVVDHINGIRTDNRVENLEWVTQSENCLRAWKSGTHKKVLGEANHATKYTDKEIDAMCQLVASGKTPKEVSILTGICIGTIQNIIGGSGGRTNIVRKYNYPNYRFSKKSPLSSAEKDKIMELYNIGTPAKDIQKILGINNLNKIIHAIYDRRYK